jgi:hypothetical protein
VRALPLPSLVVLAEALLVQVLLRAARAGTDNAGRYQKRSATPISYMVSQCPTKPRTNSFNLKNASPLQACGYKM